MPTKRYQKFKEGQTIEVKLPGVIDLACCDCGLVHRISFAIEENGKLGMAMQRRQRETQARRKTFRPEDPRLCLYPHRRCKLR